MRETFKIVIVGGSGQWCEESHARSILALKKKGLNVQVTAICDPVSPYESKSNKNLCDLIAIDKPDWLYDTNRKSLSQILYQHHFKKKIDLIIVCSPPIYNFFYCNWATKHSIHVLCEKPILLVKDASSNYKAAKDMVTHFNQLLENTKRNNSDIIINLNQRTRQCYIDIVDELSSIYSITGDSATYINCTTSFGITRFLSEFIDSGAHGYNFGVGTLGHSFYHYLDLIVWFFLSTPSDVLFFEVSVPYVLRVRDYLQSNSLELFAKLLDIPNSEIVLNNTILDCEYDFIVNIKLISPEKHTLGMITLSNYNSALSYRTNSHIKVGPLESLRDNGRTKHFNLDIFQGKSQHINFIRSQPAGSKFSAFSNYTINPLLIKKKSYFKEYDVYNSPAENILSIYIESKLANNKYSKFLESITSQHLTFNLMAKIYQIIAKQSGNMKNIPIDPFVPVLR